MTPLRTLRLATLGVVALASTGCYLNSAGKELERQVAMIEARQNEFTATFESDRERLTELVLRAETNIEELEGALVEAQAFLQRNNADLGARVDQQAAEVGDIRGRIEESQHQLLLLREELDLLREELDLRFESLAD